MSQDIRGKLKEREKVKGGSSGYEFFGSVPANRVYKFLYAPLGIPYWYWVENLPEIGWMEYKDVYLPVLCPYAFNSRASPSDGSIDDIMEYF
jgi:hypothetical protein